MNTQSRPNYTAIAWITALIYIAFNLIYRPIMPVDETRYVSVAWEMWRDHSWLVPHINGETYAHKPPLMFWLINLAWAIFGVSDTVTRLVVPLLALLNFPLVSRLAKKLYPDTPQAAALAPLVLFSFAGWALYAGLTLFDLMLGVFIQAAILGLWTYNETAHKRWIVASGISLGLALLCKGPVAFVFFIPFALLCYFRSPRNGKPSVALLKASLGALAISIVIILAWAIPAAIAGGKDYAIAIFWGQSAGRIGKSFAHARPWYWYLMVIPLITYPWLFLTGFWKSAPWKNLHQSDTFCLAFGAIILLTFSLFSGKQIHYLFPVFPFLAIWIAANLDLKRQQREPVILLITTILTVAILSSPLWIKFVFKNVETHLPGFWWATLPALLTWALYSRKIPNQYRLPLNLIAFPLGFAALLACASPILKNAYDVTAFAREIHALQNQGQTVAFAGKYHNTFAYAGRLEKPLVIAPDHGDRLRQFLAENSGVTVWKNKKITPEQAQATLYRAHYKSGWLLLLDNKKFSDRLAQRNQDTTLENQADNSQ